MPLVTAQAIGRVARASYPGHRRHGFVSHVATDRYDVVVVRCECGDPLFVGADEIRRDLFDESCRRAGDGAHAAAGIPDGWTAP